MRIDSFEWDFVFTMEIWNVFLFVPFLKSILEIDVRWKGLKMCRYVADAGCWVLQEPEPEPGRTVDRDVLATPHGLREGIPNPFGEHDSDGPRPPIEAVRLLEEIPTAADASDE